MRQSPGILKCAIGHSNVFNTGTDEMPAYQSRGFPGANNKNVAVRQI